MNGRLVLASASPQRRTLLEGLGVEFDVLPSRVDEAACPEQDPAKRAVLLASLKARDVHGSVPAAWIIGCDTLVVSRGGELLEKPQDEQDARRMIALQSGQASLVHSGLSLRSPAGEEWAGLSSSTVRFRPMSERDIDWWIREGFWRGRSGAFQIDGPGQLMIERIEGDWTSIVGLPVFLLGELCRKANVDPFGTR